MPTCPCGLILCVFTYVLHCNSEFLITFVNEMSYLKSKSQQNDANSKLPSHYLKIV